VVLRRGLAVSINWPCEDGMLPPWGVIVILSDFIFGLFSHLVLWPPLFEAGQNLSLLKQDPKGPTQNTLCRFGPALWQRLTWRPCCGHMRVVRFWVGVGDICWVSFLDGIGIESLTKIRRRHFRARWTEFMNTVVIFNTMLCLWELSRLTSAKKWRLQTVVSYWVLWNSNQIRFNKDT
jgi:hypothetical protein